MKILKLGLTGLILGLAVWVGMLGWALLTTAQSAEDAANEESKACANEVKEVMQSELQAFAQYMQDTFSNEAPNSHLIRGATQRLKLLRQRIMDAYNEHYSRIDESDGEDENEENRKTYLQHVTEATQCHDAMDTFFSYIIAMARENITATAGGKKATLLVDRYKEINEQLNELSFDVAKMAGLFKALGSRLPCCEKNQSP